MTRQRYLVQTEAEIVKWFERQGGIMQKFQMEKAVAETELLSFRPSAIHGFGGFARHDILLGTRIVEYVGMKISKAESLARCERNNEYIFSLDEHHDLDGNVEWNPARLINHSCDPNCDAEIIDGRIWIVARRGIGAGEEVTFNYGFDLVDYQDYPCRCGATSCIGYMVAEEFFPDVRRRNDSASGNKLGMINSG